MSCRIFRQLSSCAGVRTLTYRPNKLTPPIPNTFIRSRSPFAFNIPRFQSTMLSYQYSALPHLEKGKHVRLLRLRPGDFSDDLHVELEQVLLDGISTYEALSYVWGSTAHPISVLVGPSREHTISVTQNLATALRHLRYVDEYRMLWVDAVCIDQSNVAERSDQVTLMSDIYRGAHEVVVWLGPEENDSSRAFDLMCDVGSRIDVDWTNYSIKPKVASNNPSYWRLVESQKYPFQHDEAHAVNHLLHRQWFKRLWIRQEIGLATQAVVCCGRHFIPWHLFRNAVLFIYQNSAHFAPALEVQWAHFTTRLELVLRICERREYRFQDLRADLAQTVCEDHRDKLYGVLSLLPPHQQNMGIVPDYSWPVDIVYHDATVRFINHTMNLAILLQCELQDTGQYSMLKPTWVPDWSIDLKATSFFGTSNVSANFAPIATFDTRHNRLRSATMATIDEDIQYFRVAGVATATIQDVQLVQSDKNDVDFGIALRALWEMSISNLTTSNDTSTSQLSAVCDALCCGFFRHYMIPVGENLPDFKTVKPIFEHLVLRYSLLSGDKITTDNWVRYRGRVRQMCHNRSFFVTRGGSVGVAPISARPGDIVCILLGCQSPIILRQTGADTYQVVGQSYMSGVNTGEVLLGHLPEDLRRVSYSDDQGKSYRSALWNEHTNRVQFKDPRLDKLLRNPGFEVRDHGESRLPTIKTSVEALRNAGIAAQYFDLV